MDTEPIIYKRLNYSTAVLLLGIISIFGYFAFVLPGLILSILALVFSKKANNIYKLNPNLYTKSSYSDVKAGKAIAIIGLAIFGVIAFFFLAYGILYSMSGFKD